MIYILNTLASVSIYLKNNKYFGFVICLTLIFLFMFSCKKQELAIANPPKVVILHIDGSTVNDTLEFVKDGKIIAESPRAYGQFGMDVMVTVDGPEADMQVRLKGHTEILTTRKILADAFKQSVQCHYDGEKTYDNSVRLLVKGYAKTGIMEFIVDGKIIGSSSISSVAEGLVFGIEADKSRQFQIRKQGEIIPLLTREIPAAPSDQTINFYYDGEKIVDKIELVKPSNPANMTFCASFTSTVDVYTGPADLLILTGNGNITNYAPTNMRIEFPVDGSFSNIIELPPMEAGKYYAYKLVKRGTLNDLPYNLTNQITPIKPESGTNSITFVAGGSVIMAIRDSKTARATPVSIKGTTFFASGTDITQYFK